MVIVAQGLGFTYYAGTPLARKALQGIDLSIPPASWTAVVGRTASGKSTLVQHFNGLLIPTEGELTVEQVRIRAGQKRIPPLVEKVGLIFQRPEDQLFEETVEQEITFGPRQLGWPQEKIAQRLNAVLEQVGVERAWLSRSFLELSGGQRRRVAIAGVLILDPDILVMDEPTLDLDPEGKNHILNLIKEWQKAGQKTVIHVTHQMEEVAQFAEHVIVLHEGRVAFCGTPLSLFLEKGEELAGWGLELPLSFQLLRQLNAKLAEPIHPSSPAKQDVLAAIARHYRKERSKS